MDSWRLTLAADEVLDVEPDRLLPRVMVRTAGTAFDFSTPRELGGVTLDNAFRGVPSATATLTGPDGFATITTWDERSPWVQVCTIDLAPEPWRRAGLAVEPMSCPPDAFNSGTDLWLLQPGERRDLGLRIRAGG